MKRLIAITTAAIASLTGIGGYLVVSTTPASAAQFGPICASAQIAPQPSATVGVDTEGDLTSGGCSISQTLPPG